MKPKLNYVNIKLNNIKKNNLYRKMYDVTLDGPYITINSKKLVNFCSNDYLGIKQLKISKKIKHALISLGQIKSSKIRINLYKKAINAGFKMPIIKSPHAYVSPRAKIGKGTIIMHGAVVNANAIIGKNCIINTNCIIEHDAFVGDHCHVSTGAILNGKVVLGRGSFVGSGCVIKEEIKIGNNDAVLELYPNRTAVSNQQQD